MIFIINLCANYTLFLCIPNVSFQSLHAVFYWFHPCSSNRVSKKIDDLEYRVDLLENRANAMEKLLNAVQKRLYITSVGYPAEGGVCLNLSDGTWVNLQIGKQQISDFKVDEDSGIVFITFADGNTIQLQMASKLFVSFEFCDNDSVAINTNSRYRIRYKLSPNAGEITKEVIPSAGIKAEFMDDDIIAIYTADTIPENSKVVFIATNGSSTVMKRINIEERRIRIDGNDTIRVSRAAQEVALPFFSNFNPTIRRDPNCSWIMGQNPTKAVKWNIASVWVTKNGGTERGTTVTVGDSYTNITYTIIQDHGYTSTDYSRNGHVTVLQRAEEGDGIDVILFGNGFSDRQIEQGKYLQLMQKTCEYLFGVEPYKSFKKFFTIYVVDAVSENEIMGPGRNTTKYEPCDDVCLEFLNSALPELFMLDSCSKKLCFKRKTTVIAVNNRESSDKSGDSAINLFARMGADSYWHAVCHEVGHKIGLLKDEYVWGKYKDTMVPDNYYKDSSVREREIKDWRNNNVDYTNDLTSVH